MTTYTVVKGDTLWGISKKYKTTIDIIKADNTFIKNVDKLTIGWKLTIRTPQEVAADKAAKAKTAQAAAQNKKTEAQGKTSTPQTKDSTPKVFWGNAEVVPGQVGRVVITKEIRMIEFSSPGSYNSIGAVKPPEKYRVLEIKDYTGVYAAGGKVYNFTKLYRVAKNAWLPNLSEYVTFEEIPDDVRKKMNSGAGTKVVSPPAEDFMSPTIPYFESPGYRRPVLQVKKDNKIITMELRVVSAAGSYSMLIQQNQTNAGWLINISGSGLTVMSLSGVFLDTKTNKEFDDFISRYKQYVTAYRDGDFYSSAICTLYYKGREYKGLIAAFNYNDQESEKLLRRYTIQFVILKEKGPESGKITIPAVVGKNKSMGDDFYSDIRYLLLNPMTGKYGYD